MSAPAPISGLEKRRIAPVWHTVGMLVLLAVPVASGVYQQRHPEPGSQIFSSHSVVFLRFYVPVLLYEWALVAYLYWGLRRSGTPFLEIVAGNWARAAYFVRDLGLAVAFAIGGIFCISIVIKLLGPGHSKGISTILPQTPAEIVLWVVISLTAGFVEELIYRGYLQTQFQRFGMPTAVAIAAQAIVFGAGHAYEGMSRAVAITVFAIFAGAVAAWRRSLRPNMMGHAMMDLLAAVAKTA